MDISRRELLALAVGSAAAALVGCGKEDQPPAMQSTVPTESSPNPATRPVNSSLPSAVTAPSAASGEPVADAGLLGDYARDGVYAAFREQGFFIVRRDGKLRALSSICTHRACKITAQADDSFLCKCHKSAFDRDGRVTHGPAQRDLPYLAVDVDARQHVLVKLVQPGA